MLDLLRSHFKNKRVFLTGHTGFKGAWMLQVLHGLGADVKGFALAPEKPHDLYCQINGDKLCYSSVIADLRDLKALQGELVRFEPHYVFHLAAQSLVRRSYSTPVDTFAVNTLGTVHILEAMRSLSAPCIGVMITTDKVYENPERGEAFSEQDKLGGYDPYSASKAAAEIVIDSYRRSFFHPQKQALHQKVIASVRAGNVIGGGDYADDRIIPDIVRAIESNRPVVLRNPQSVRPWQHVLEPISAYLKLAVCMQRQPAKFGTAYNFGPEPADERTVEDLTKIFLTAYGGHGQYEAQINPEHPHEANLLMLDSTKAKQELEWQPRLTAEEAIQWSATWYANRKTDARTKCQQQIEAYFNPEP